MRTFEQGDGETAKFWSIERKGKVLTTTAGRLGTKGRSRTQEFASAALARQEHDRLVEQKLAAGYAEAYGTGAEAAERRALEAALSADPDDLAAHAAYADWLHEHGDTRGELIQVQLSLERAGLPAATRHELQQREQALLKKHGRRWLAALAPYLLGQQGIDAYCRRHGWGYQYRLTRGWLEDVAIRHSPAQEFIAALAREPLARLLRRLTIATWGTEGLDLTPLHSWPGAGTLHYLELTGPYFRSDLKELLTRLPRLEELHLDGAGMETTDLFEMTALTTLRVLEVNREQGYDLHTLAMNRAFSRLEALLLHPHDEGWVTPLELDEIQALLRARHLPSLRRLRLELYEDGDAVSRALARSKLLGQLEEVELRFGDISDKGALALAKAPALKNLKRLDVSHNELTPAGIAALAARVPRLVADEQSDPGAAGEWDDTHESEWE